MRFSTWYKTLSLILVAISAVWVGSSWTHAAHRLGPAEAADAQGCPNDDSGLALPAGFCATIFADGIGHARQWWSRPAEWFTLIPGRADIYGNDTPHAGGFLVACRTNRHGKG